MVTSRPKASIFQVHRSPLKVKEPVLIISLFFYISIILFGRIIGYGKVKRFYITLTGLLTKYYKSGHALHD